MKRSEIKKGLLKLSESIPFNVYESPLDFAEKAAEWALGQVREWLDSEIELMNKDRDKQLSVTGLAELCDIEDNK